MAILGLIILLASIRSSNWKECIQAGNWVLWKSDTTLASSWCAYYIEVVDNVMIRCGGTRSWHRLQVIRLTLRNFNLTGLLILMWRRMYRCFVLGGLLLDYFFSGRLGKLDRLTEHFLLFTGSS